MTTLEQIRECTYANCFKCSSIHVMKYACGTYTCEECYREVASEEAEDVEVDWPKFAKLVNNSTTPKKCIKMLLDRVWGASFTPETVDDCLEQLKRTGVIVP
jgi:hypothetical protein